MFIAIFHFLARFTHASRANITTLPRLWGGFLILAIALAPSWSEAQETSQANQEQLELLQQELKEKQRDYEEIKQKEQNLLKELQSIDQELKRYTQQLQQHRQELAENQQQLQQVQATLSDLETNFQQQRKTLMIRLRAIYKMGDLGYMAPLLALSSQPDMQQQIKYLQVLSEHDIQLLNNAQNSMQAINTEKAKLEQQKQKIVAAQEEIRIQEQKIAVQKQQKAKLLHALQQDKQQFAQVIKNLEASAERLEKLLENLGEEQAPEAIPETPVAAASRPGKEIVFPDNIEDTIRAYGQSFRSNKGKLLWPVPGKVITNFGKIKYGETYTFYKGVDIQAARGTPFYSVFRGTVKYADWFEDYGNLVIIDHGGNYYTLYAHADEISVSAGQNIETRQMLGRVGDTDSIKGSHLYFEIRANGKPVDPQGWLVKIR